MNKLSFILLFSSLISINCLSAPLPGSTTSALVKPQLGIYKSKHGFQFLTEIAGWKKLNAPKTAQNIETVYGALQTQNNVRPTLSVRVDDINSKMALKNYVSLWQKEYPKFGFKVLGSKEFNINSNKGYVVDLLNKSKNRQLRQVIFKNGSKTAILTCRDHIKTFKKSLKNCNKIIKSFNWKTL